MNRRGFIGRTLAALGALYFGGASTRKDARGLSAADVDDLVDATLENMRGKTRSQIADDYRSFVVKTGASSSADFEIDWIPISLEG